MKQLDCGASRPCTHTYATINTVVSMIQRVGTQSVGKRYKYSRYRATCGWKMTRELRVFTRKRGGLGRVQSRSCYTGNCVCKATLTGHEHVRHMREFHNLYKLTGHEQVRHMREFHHLWYELTLPLPKAFGCELFFKNPYKIHKCVRTLLDRREKIRNSLSS